MKVYAQVIDLDGVIVGEIQTPLAKVEVNALARLGPREAFEWIRKRRLKLKSKRNTVLGADQISQQNERAQKRKKRSLK